MEKEFVNSMEISISDIQSLPDPSPSFRIWVWKMMNDGYLNQIIWALIVAGVAENNQQALIYLNELGREFEIKDSVICCCDFKNNEHSARLFKKLELIMGEQNNKGGQDDYKLYGTVCHSLLSKLFSKSLPEPRLLTESHQQFTFSFFKEDEILNYQTINGAHPQGDLFEPLMMIAQAKSGLEINFRKIKKAWHRIIQTMNEIWPYWYFESLKDINRLQNLFYPLLDKNAHLFKSHLIRDKNYDTVLSLMSLASAVIYFQQNIQRVFFTEIPVISTKQKLSGGRIDAVEIRSIGGNPPTKKQLRYLRSITRSRFKSVAHLAQILNGIFGQKIEFNILDWKFVIGDGNWRQIIQPQDIPLPNHIAQVKKYLALSSLGYALARGKRQNEKDFWSGFHHATLVYFLPDSPPILYPIVMDSNQNENTFLEEIVTRWEDAGQRAAIRHMSNHLLSHIIELFDRKKLENHSGTTSNTTENVSLFLESEKQSSVITVIQSYRERTLRQPVDALGIIERVNNILVMHIDRLFSAIEEGKIVTAGIRSRGGFIRCLMPDHDDASPSMHVSFPRLQFKCFSCGAWGKLTSIPAEIREEIAPINFARNYFGTEKNISAEVKNAVIPETHCKVMSLAQKLLLSQFKHSQAEYYISKKRYIDSDLAFSLGAGYGTDNVINGLLDSGLTLDDLIFYGFVGISEKINSSQGITHLLKKRGMRDEEIKRPINILVLKKKFREKLKNSWGYPYFVLERRITFPLELAGKMTNFYGRATYQCNPIFYHRKLYTGNSGVPQGGFNMGVINSDHQEIKVTESVIDALSTIMLGLTDSKSVAALIGVANYLIAEELIDSGKNIALALNLDVSKSKSGQKATVKLTDYIKKRSHQKVRDFTADFMTKHPEVPDKYKKDYNMFLEFKVKSQNLKI